MCGSIFLGIFFGALAVKAMRRLAFHRHGGYGGHGGGCGGRGRRFMYYRWSGQHGGGSGWGGPGESREEGPWGIRGGARSSKPIAEVLKSLELNERQRQEAAPVLALAQEWIGASGARIEAALLAVGSERFEPVLIDALLEGVPENVRREVVDGLEHLHTILIPEQREQLRTQLSRSKPAATPTGSTGGEGTL